MKEVHYRLNCVDCDCTTRHLYDGPTRTRVTANPPHNPEGRRTYRFDINPPIPDNEDVELRPIWYCVVCDTQRVWGS